MHCTLSLTVCKCTPCQRASFNSTTDSFSWGHDPYTLACKARPSSDRCWTSLSVSLSLSLSLLFHLVSWDNVTQPFVEVQEQLEHPGGVRNCSLQRRLSNAKHRGGEPRTMRNSHQGYHLASCNRVVIFVKNHARKLIVSCQLFCLELPGFKVSRSSFIQHAVSVFFHSLKS